VKPLLLTGVAALVATASAPNAPPGATEVEVVGLDYAFRVPAELPAGVTTFRFRNAGKVRHEFVVTRQKPGATIDQLAQLVKDSMPLEPVTDGIVGILVAAPGKESTSKLTTTLAAGRQYVVVCFIRDTTTAPSHFQMGMYSVVNVRSSTSKAVPDNVKADTIVGSDYAFRYPRTLSPGQHSFVFRNEGNVRHEFNIALLKKGVTLERFLEVRRATPPKARDLLDDNLGALLSRGGVTPLGRLDVNLLPGREYRIICVFRDDPKSPPHFELGMYGSIQVTGKPAG
jgi:hypothetical protein